MSYFKPPQLNTEIKKTLTLFTSSLEPVKAEAFVDSFAWHRVTTCIYFSI